MLLRGRRLPDSLQGFEFIPSTPKCDLLRQSRYTSHHHNPHRAKLAFLVDELNGFTTIRGCLDRGRVKEPIVLDAVSGEHSDS